MAPKATKRSVGRPKGSGSKSKVPKLEKDVKPTRDELDGGEMGGYKYFGKYRIIDETDLSFHCPAKEDAEVATYIGGFQFTLAKCGRDKVSLTCGATWEMGKTVLADLHFYCLPDKNSQLPMTSDTFYLEELSKGTEIVASEEILRINCPATYGVYIRLLKEWDVTKRPWNSRETKTNLKYVVRGREFNVLKDFMAATSGYIQACLDEMCGEDSNFVNIDHDPQQFDIFLHAIDGMDPVLPTPETVRFLTMYAFDYFIPTLLAKCEKHLKFCHEIPLMERLKLAIDYEMKDAQIYLLSLVTNHEWTRAKSGSDRKEFDELVEAVPNFYEWLFDREHFI